MLPLAFAGVPDIMMADIVQRVVGIG